MLTHTIAAIDLPVQDVLVLRATLTQLDRSDCIWRHVEDESQADVVLFVISRAVSLGAIVELEWPVFPLRIAISPPLSAPHQDGFGIVLPLRARELSTALNLLSTKIRQKKAQQIAVSAAAITISAHDLIIHLTSGMQQTHATALALHVGSNAILTIDKFNAQLNANEIVWSTRAFSELRSLCVKIAKGAILALEQNVTIANQKKANANATCRGSLNQLIWILAAYEVAPSPALPWGEDARFSLKHWPDFGTLPATLDHLKIAGLITRRPHTLETLIHLSSVGRLPTLAFLNACHWLGLLTIKSPSAPAPVPHAGSGSIPVRYRIDTGSASLVISIRNALRKAIARATL